MTHEAVPFSGSLRPAADADVPAVAQPLLRPPRPRSPLSWPDHAAATGHG